MLKVAKHRRVFWTLANSVVRLLSATEVGHPRSDDWVAVLGTSDVLGAVLADVLVLQLVEGFSRQAVSLHHRAMQAAADGVYSLGRDLPLLVHSQLRVVSQT